MSYPSDFESGIEKPAKPKWPRVLLGCAALATAFALGWFLRATDQPANTPAATLSPAPTAELEAPATHPRTDALSETVARTAGENELLNRLREQLPKSLGDVLQSLATIAETRPALAIDLAQALGRTDEEKTEWVTNVMQQWADRDPQDAWRWLGQLSFKRVQDLAGGELASVILGAMAAHAPQMVLANVDTLLRQGNTSESVSTPVAVHLGIQALVERGQVELAQQAVETWAKDPSKLNIEAAAYETVAMALAENAPHETAAWLRKMPLSDERNAAIATFTATWAEKDPSAALQWAEKLPANEGLHAALGRTVSDWVERYPVEIGTWLGNYLVNAPADSHSDTLVKTVVNLSPLVQSDPKLALQWTDLIADPQQKATTEERVFLRWGRQDKTAAIDYVQKNSTLPPERKLSLVQKIQNSQVAHEE